MENYDQQLDKLKNEEIKEIYVEREDRKYFVVEDAHNGNITYRYDETVL